MSTPTPEPARECIWCGATDNLTERAINPARITKTWECEGDACPLPPLDLDALDRLLTAASPGPWSTGEDGLVWAARVMGDPVSGSTEIPDAELIAAARNALPELIWRAREAERLRADRIMSVVFGHHPGAPRPFALRRQTDVTGVSGTGVVAEGCAFSDGSAVLRWLTEWPTSVVWHDRGVESIEHVHGHGGATEIVWCSDELEPLAEMEQQRDEARAEAARLAGALRDVLSTLSSGDDRGEVHALGVTVQDVAVWRELLPPLPAVGALDADAPVEPERITRVWSEQAARAGDHLVWSITGPADHVTEQAHAALSELRDFAGDHPVKLRAELSQVHADGGDPR